MKHLLVIVFWASFLTVCEMVIAADNLATEKTQSKEISGEDKATVAYLAIKIQSLLATKRYEELVGVIHPTKGILMPTYLTIDRTASKQFSRQQFRDYLLQPQYQFTWHTSLVTTLPNFLTTQVAAKRFDDATMTINRLQNVPSEYTNIPALFPTTQYSWVQFKSTIEQRKQYVGDYTDGALDTIVMIFERYLEQYYLVALVTDLYAV